jgi:hypothetical protein
MGAFNNLFEELRECATKLVKFKQKVAIEAAHKQGAIDNAHFQVVEEGACASFVMAWLLQKFSGIGVFSRGKGVSTGASPANIAIVQDAIPGYVAYTQAVLPDQKRKDLAWNYGLFLDARQKVRFDSFADLTEWATYCLDKNKAIYVSAVLKDQGGNHALGIYHDSQGGHHFFDPNIGEYLIHEDMDGIFYQTYTNLLKLRRGDEYAACWSYPVSCD